MKRMITLVAALILFVAANQAQTLKDLFNRYCDDERFEYVSVGKGMMNMASIFGGVAKNEKQLMSKMRGVKILTLNSNSDSQLMKSVQGDMRQVLDAGEFETAVEVREKGERVHIHFRVTGKDNADILIVTKDRNELSMIWITAKMTKEEMMDTFSAGDDSSMEIYENRGKQKDSIS